MPENLYPVELLEARIQSMKDALRKSRLMTVIELLISTYIILSIGRYASDATINVVFAIVCTLVVNGVAWCGWAALGLLRFRHLRHDARWEEPLSYESVWESYRAHAFFLRSANRREAIFDVLLGLQFIGLVVALTMMALP